MRFVFVAQLAATALLVCGCPGTQSTDPSGGALCPSGETCPNENSGGGGAGNSSGEGGAGNGSGQGGAGNGNGQGGAGNGSGQGGAGNGSGAGAGTGAGGNLMECEGLQSDLEVKYIDAQTCNPLSDQPQCKDTIPGPCCDILVALKDSPAVVKYLEALEAYQNAGCGGACPPEPCPPMPTGVCTPQGAPNTGICVELP